MNDVFILGAGFSRDLAGLPTMPELGLEVLDEIGRLPDTATKHYLTNDIPASVTENVETLVTYLGQSHPWRTVEENHLAAAGQVVVSKLIENVIRDRLSTSSHAPEALTAAQQLVLHCHKWESVILTFNYDTLVEILAEDVLQYKSVEYRSDRGYIFAYIERLQIIAGDDEPRTHPPPEIRITWDEETKELLLILPNRETTEKEIIEAVRSEGVIPEEFFDRDMAYARVDAAMKELRQKVPSQSLYQIPVNNVAGRTASLWSTRRAKTLRLLKLHGSINWYYSGTSGYAGEQLYFSRPSTSPMRDSDISWNTADLVPVIIPPSIDKTSFYTNISLRSQWTMAESALRLADRVFVLGYSCPTTDFSTSFMIQRALAATHASVHVFCMSGAPGSPSREEIFQRYSALVGGGAQPTLHDVPIDQSSISTAVAML